MRGRILILSVVALAACATNAKDSASAGGLSVADRNSIATARESVIAALNAANLDQLYAHFTADHITAPPNGVSLPIGPQLRAWHEGLLNQNVVRSSFTPPELVGAGDVAVDRYDYTLNVQPKAGGQPTEDRGKGLWIWRRQADNSWKLAYAIWNSDLPAPLAK